MSMEGLPLAVGATGEPVRDLQRRLIAAGFDPGDEPGTYGGLTEAAVRRFQEHRLLNVDGVCGRDTWSALIEASYDLGDRLLYLRRPMLRGDDVVELQLKLGALGFDAGRVDGIFGPNTELALKDFQRNTALNTDGVCGPDVLHALGRLGAMTAGPGQVAGIRERDRLANAPRKLAHCRVAIGNLGGLEVPVSAISKALREAGASVSVLQHPDRAVQAAEANAFDASLYVGLTVSTEDCARAAYYATTGFESIGGRRLAELIVHEVAPADLAPTLEPSGMRLPILRETRMPAVVCHLTDIDRVVNRNPELAAALTRAIEKWVAEPLGEP
jgi:N-acetylmuramoyl-L-alanine amidase